MDDEYNDSQDSVNDIIRNNSDDNECSGDGKEFQEGFSFDDNYDEEEMGYGSRGGRGGRGNFRGRGRGPPPGWMNGPPMRFRGRGYGPSGPPMRGRGFFRGRGGPRFNNGPNFDGNWGPMGPPPPGMMGGPPPFGPPPGMMGPGGPMGPPPNMMGQPPPFGGPPGMPPPNMQQGLELWVETKSEDGKSYFYHSRTRETTWTRPQDTPNCKVITQAEMEAMAASGQMPGMGGPAMPMGPMPGGPMPGMMPPGGPGAGPGVGHNTPYMQPPPWANKPDNKEDSQIPSLFSKEAVPPFMQPPPWANKPDGGSSESTQDMKSPTDNDDMPPGESVPVSQPNGFPGQVPTTIPTSLPSISAPNIPQMGLNSGPNMGPGGSNMGPGGPSLGSGVPSMAPGGPNMGPGGPNMGSGPNMQPGGPSMGPGGTNMGPGPNMGPGGPNSGPGGPNMGHGGPNMGPGGPNMGPGGPNMGHGGPNMLPGGPNMGPGGPNMGHGGPNMGPGGPNMGPGGPNMGPGGQNMGPGGPNMRPGGPNMGPGPMGGPWGPWSMGPGGPGWPPMAGQQPNMMGQPMPGGMPPGAGQPSQAVPALNDALAEDSKIPPELLAAASEWTAHKAPDGRCYYYHARRHESVWDKPQPIKDLEEFQAKLAAEKAGATPEQNTPKMDVDEKPVEVIDVDAQPTPMKEVQRAPPVQDKDKDEKKPDGNKPMWSTHIAGTPWRVVWTAEGRVFFFNPSIPKSVWARPPELLGREDVDKIISEPPKAVMKLQQANAVNTETTNGELKRPADTESDDSEEEPTKKVKSEEGPKKPASQSIDNSKEAAKQAEALAAIERAILPLEQRMATFRQMLLENDVSAFSTWKKELHKIVFDKRYLLLTSEHRKQVFSKYVRERAEEERKEKMNRLQQRKNAFIELMQEAKLHSKSSYLDFASKFGKDERFKGIDKPRNRETYFSEFLVELKKKEKEDKEKKKEQVRTEFYALLSERGVERQSRWAETRRRLDNEPRFRNVDAALREDYFRDYCRRLSDRRHRDSERDRSMSKKEKKDKERDKDREKDREKDRDKDREGKEKDREGKEKDREGKEKDREGKEKDREGKEKKKKDKKDKERDKGKKEEKERRREEKEREKEKEKEREREIEKDSDQADTSAEIEHHSPSESEGDDESKAVREREARAQASIKEREREVQRVLATSLRDRDKERQFHKRDEAVQHFNALLADLVRNPDLTWREAKKQLKKDHRYNLAELLSKEDKERLFTQHQNVLSNKRREKLRTLLDSLNVTTTTRWRDVKKLLKEEPRAPAYKPEQIEREFREYQRNKISLAKNSFRQQLLETRSLTHKSLAAIKENEDALKAINDELSADARYTALEQIPEERDQILTGYLEELQKKGPPPPPTATEPTRRSKQ